MKRKTNAAHRVTGTSAAGTFANETGEASFAAFIIADTASDAIPGFDKPNRQARLIHAVAAIRRRHGRAAIRWGCEVLR